MRAGLLSDRVTITRPVTSADAIGGQTVAWAPVAASVPARVEMPSGREALEAQGITATANVKVTLRYREDVTAKMRVTDVGTGMVFEVQSVDPFQLPRRTTVLLYCSVVQATAGATV